MKQQFQPHSTTSLERPHPERRGDKMASTSKGKKGAARGLNALEISIHKKALSCPKQVCQSHGARIFSPILTITLKPVS